LNLDEIIEAISSLSGPELTKVRKAVERNASSSNRKQQQARNLSSS